MRSIPWWTVFALALTLTSLAHSQTTALRFFASPYEVYAGDAVVFNYREDNRTSPAVPTVQLAEIIGWRWDFDGDGTWDQEMTVGDADPDTGLPIAATAINATWISSLPAGVASKSITPRLQVRVTGDPAFGTLGFTPKTAVGVTEDVFGTDGTVDPSITVKSRGVGNANLSTAFSVNPRLALTSDTLRFYPEVTAADGRTLSNLTYTWELAPRGGGATVTLSGQFPTQAASALSASPDGVIYDVTLTVAYTATYLNGTTTVTTSGSLPLLKKDAFRVITVPDELKLGRAYRIGFPATHGWDDIVKAYSATGAGNDDNSLGYDNNYIYFQHFEQAFFEQQNALLADSSNAAKRQTMAEVVNELLQGQTMIANQRLIEALRIKYPRISSDVDPNTERLNPPAGTREETAAIDTAILDYHAAVQFAGAAIRDYGTDILRAKAPAGAEPFPQFPLYLTITDPTLSKEAPIPIKNEDWQFTTAFERMELGRVEKAKKLWRLSTQDKTALPEAKAE